jgi:cytochrome c-type biogenesis protein CcmF
VQVGVTGPDGESRQAVPLYRFDQESGRVETPPTGVPGGGEVAVAGINASAGKVRLAFRGLPGMPGDAGEPAILSVDVSRKPLIQLVWFGLYVILFGGVLSTVYRLRQAVRGEPAPEAAAE